MTKTDVDRAVKRIFTWLDTEKIEGLQLTWNFILENNEKWKGGKWVRASKEDKKCLKKAVYKLFQDTNEVESPEVSRKRKKNEDARVRRHFVSTRPETFDSTASPSPESREKMRKLQEKERKALCALAAKLDQAQAPALAGPERLQLAATTAPEALLSTALAGPQLQQLAPITAPAPEAPAPEAEAPGTLEVDSDVEIVEEKCTAARCIDMTDYETRRRGNFDEE